MEYNEHALTLEEIKNKAAKFQEENTEESTSIFTGEETSYSDYHLEEQENDDVITINKLSAIIEELQSINKCNTYMSSNFIEDLKNCIDTLNEMRNEIASDNSEIKATLNETLDNVVNKLLESNNELKNSFKENLLNREEENKKNIMGFYLDMCKTFESKLNESVRSTIDNFNQEISLITQNHFKILENVRNIYSLSGQLKFGVWIWRYIMFVMILELLQALFKPSGLFAWVKILTGLELFS